MIYRCVQAFVTIGEDGQRVRCGYGETVPAGHWLLDGRESLFQPVGVEQATAAPGEKRSTRRKKDVAPADAESDD